MAKFNPGDRVRRKLSENYWGSVTPGGEYIVKTCGADTLQLEGHILNYAAMKFELAGSPCTPQDVVNAVAGFVQFILREPPLRVGDVFVCDALPTLEREVLGIFGGWIWLEGSTGPSTMAKSYLLDRYRRVKCGPVS
jgi:hypothetical protein